MEIVAFSDGHGYLPDIPNLGFDVCIIAGDICPNFRTESMRKHCELQADWLHTVFKPWADKCPVKRIIATWGNHDFVADYRPELIQFNDLKCTFLVDQTINIDGVKIYGTPWSNRFGNWAFMLEEDKLMSKYKDIPADTNILISHGPPKNILDKTAEGLNVGSSSLADWIKANYRDRNNHIRLVLCGHIHEARGKELISLAHSYPLTVANVAIKDRDYNVIDPPELFDYSLNLQVEWSGRDLRA